MNKVHQQRWMRVGFWSSVLVMTHVLALSTSGPKTDVHLDDRGEPNMHNILERVGKTCLRPGGTGATEQLLQWSGLTSEHKVLELSAGLGKTGLLFAQKLGCQVLITDTDERRLARAKQAAEKAKLTPLVQTKPVDMFDIDGCLGKSAHFDCAMAEASLTHYSLEKKRMFFQNLARHTDQFLLHEICFTSENSEILSNIRKDMQKVLRIGFFPETLATWHQLLQDAGFKIQQEHVGEIDFLSPRVLLQDEGPWGVARIAMNIVTQPYLRSRVLTTRKALVSHRENLGYVILRATKR